MRTSDTAELAFDDVLVPVENLLGEVGNGFSYLTHNQPQERLAIALGGCASAAAAVLGRVIDKCLQLHGGYGYITEFPIARLYADTGCRGFTAGRVKS